MYLTTLLKRSKKINIRNLQATLLQEGGEQSSLLQHKWSEEVLLQFSAYAPITMGSPKRQWQSEEQSKENFLSTTHQILAVHQLLNRGKLSSSIFIMPAPESLL